MIIIWLPIPHCSLFLVNERKVKERIEEQGPVSCEAKGQSTLCPAAVWTSQLVNLSLNLAYYNWLIVWAGPFLNWANLHPESVVLETGSPGLVWQKAKPHLDT